MNTLKQLMLVIMLGIISLVPSATYGQECETHEVLLAAFIESAPDTIVRQVIEDKPTLQFFAKADNMPPEYADLAAKIVFYLSVERERQVVIVFDKSGCAIAHKVLPFKSTES